MNESVSSNHTEQISFSSKRYFGPIFKHELSKEYFERYVKKKTYLEKLKENETKKSSFFRVITLFKAVKSTFFVHQKKKIY
jgi:hypothetical protein